MAPVGGSLQLAARACGRADALDRRRAARGCSTRALALSARCSAPRPTRARARLDRRAVADRAGAARRRCARPPRRWRTPPPPAARRPRRARRRTPPRTRRRRRCRRARRAIGAHRHAHALRPSGRCSSVGPAASVTATTRPPRAAPLVADRRAARAQLSRSAELITIASQRAGSSARVAAPARRTGAPRPRPRAHEPLRRQPDEAAPRPRQLAPRLARDRREVQDRRVERAARPDLAGPREHPLERACRRRSSSASVVVLRRRLDVAARARRRTAPAAARSPRARRA